MRHEGQAFAIVGWRTPDGRVSIVATDHPALDRAQVLAQRAGGEAPGLRVGLYERVEEFVARGEGEVGATGQGSFVPVLLDLLNRWLPAEPDAVIELCEPLTPADVQALKPGVDPPVVRCDVPGLWVDGYQPVCWLEPGHDGPHIGRFAEEWDA